jgi:hypothetical protein
LAAACLDGTATATQVARLEELLQTRSEARRCYLEFIYDSHSLQTWALAQVESELAASASEVQSQDETDVSASGSVRSARGSRSRRPVSFTPVRRTTTHPRRHANPFRTSVFVACAVVASIVVLGGLFLIMPPAAVPPENPPAVAATTPVASVVKLRDCRWADGEQMDVGAELLEGQQLELLVGVAELRFLDGATVTVEGPANLELISAGGAHLHSGVLTSYVPAEAVGFHVRTDTLDVTDLGTAFGVAVGEDKQTNVSVFSGRIEVALTGSGGATKQIVEQGESVRASVQQALIEYVEFVAEPFRQAMSASTGIASTEGKCGFVAQQAIGGLLPEHDEMILVGLEQRDFVLPRDLAVEIHEPGSYPAPEGNQLGSIPAGNRVHCFLVQFRPSLDAVPNDGASAAGRITFDRPILGIISGAGRLTKTDELFAGGDTGIEQARRGGEGTRNPRERDTLVLSDDRHTIEITAHLRRHMDQIRVLVDAAMEDTGPPRPLAERPE